MGKQPTRAADERLLTILRLRDEGLTTTAIAKALGISNSTVCGELHRFRKDQPHTGDSDER